MSIRTWLQERSEREFARREREQARTKGYAVAAQGEFEALWRIIDRRGVELQKRDEKITKLCKLNVDLTAENARLRVRAAELQEHLSHLLDARDGAR